MADLQKYKPFVYNGVLEYEELLSTGGLMLSPLEEAVQLMQDDNKMSTMSLDGVKQYENILGIVANPSIEPLEFRRERIINRLSTRPPFTLPFLYERLNEIVGKNKWKVTMDYGAYTLYVESSAQEQGWANELYITINSIKPANIVYVPVPAVFNGIALSSYAGYSQNTANYVAGQWIVGQKDIVGFEDKGLVKMATQKYMKDQMFEDVLAKLNDTIIHDFIFNGVLVKLPTKTVLSATNQIECLVDILAADGLTTLTQVAIRNASGQILEEYPLSIPVLDGITFKVVETVGEGVVV